MFSGPPLINSEAELALTLPQAFRTPVKRPHPGRAREGDDMLHYAIVFLVIALVAALFGFGGIAAGAVEIAKILFFVFVIMAVVAFVISIGRKG
jgi:uncharacterized membrane protein YtjA (UPF0391 family)